MRKKIKEFFPVLLKKLKALTPILHSSEVESVFKSLIEKFKNAEPDEVMNVISSFFLMVTSLGFLSFVIFLFIYFGGL